MTLDVDRNKIYYIAGPMTGLPEYNYAAFEKAQEELGKIGIRTVSPHAIDYTKDEPQGRGSALYTIYIKGGFRLLLQADGIILLPGWTRSAGARNELDIALDCGYPVLFLLEYDNEGPVLIDMERR